MKKARFTSEFGKEIFVLDLDVEQPEDAIPLIRECARQVRSKPKGSVLTLTLLKPGKFTPFIVTELQNLARGNKEYVKRAAVVGVSGPFKIAMNAVSIFSKREFRVYDFKETALTYLLSEDIGATKTRAY